MSYTALIAKDQMREDIASRHSDGLCVLNTIPMARIVDTSYKDGSME